MRVLMYRFLMALGQLLVFCLVVPAIPFALAAKALMRFRDWSEIGWLLAVAEKRIKNRIPS